MKKTVNFRNNLRLTLSIDDWIQQHIYFTGTYEERELLFIEKNLKTGGTFIDIGANIGLFSVTASAMVGAKGKVFSFEPFSTNYYAFKENIRINKIENITVERKAISDKDETISLYYDQKEFNLGMVSSYATAHSLKEEIVSTSLDAYLTTKDINAIDIIKIDIEGGEYPALLGMKQTLLSYKPLLIVEMDANILISTPYSEADIISYMASLNYIPYYIDNNINLIKEREAFDNSMNVVFVHNS